MRIRMLSFLKETKKLLDTKKPITFVLGNESCDLDSAVSATCLAYFYQMQQDQQQRHIELHQCCDNLKHYVPVLNIPRADYVIKTEVEYVFNKYAILADMLTFRDDIPNGKLETNDIILVDHHVSPFIRHCVEIYDHRPLDKSAKIPENCKVNMENVGSCATLIAEQVLNGCAQDKHLKAVCGFTMLSLLRSTIVLDTVNFNEKAKRATPKDLEICTQLEAEIEIFGNNIARDELFNEMVDARQDIGALTVAQVLRKDLKTLSVAGGAINVALAGFPLKVPQLIARENAALEIQTFARDNKLVVVMLMGMAVQADESVERDIGLIAISQANLCDAIRKKLLALQEPNLQLQPYEELNFLDGSYYRQLNIKATRKHILPVVKATLDEWWNSMSEEMKLDIECDMESTSS